MSDGKMYVGEPLRLLALEAVLVKARENAPAEKGGA
jgi:hypothetical protein